MSYQQSKRDNISDSAVDMNFRQVSRQLLRKQLEDSRDYH